MIRFEGTSRLPIHALLALSFALATTVRSDASHAEEFPYVAYVTNSETYVRSGPGQRYYPTSQVPQGFAVEVYRHEPGGWCAIRPPEGSFSWVSSHQVRQVDQAIVEVVEDNVVTRVGSVLSASRSAVQVLLPKGERVQFLPEDEDADPRWVRVLPPSGEFRWIATNSISRQPPTEIEPLAVAETPSASQTNGLGWTRQSHASESIAADGGIKQGDRIAIPHEEQVRPPTAAALPLALAPTLPTHVEPNAVDSNAMEVVAGSPAALQLAQFQAEATPPALLSNESNTPTTPTAIRPRVRFSGISTPTKPAIGSVEELELQLSQAVVKPPKEWKLESLEAAAKSLLAATNVPPVKAQLRDVLDRISRFRSVQAGYVNPGPTIVPERDPFEATAKSTVSPTAATADVTGLTADVRERVKQDFSGKGTAPVAAAPSSASVTKPLYDATGLLKPVVSQRHKAPEYALVDEQGKVVSFVTPTPEIDLKPYIGQRIGVHGARGFMPEYRRAHVTAGRVTPIEGTLRR